MRPGATRFLLEIVRTNEAVFLGLTESQWIGVVLGLGSGTWPARQRRCICHNP